MLGDSSFILYVDNTRKQIIPVYYLFHKTIF